MNLEECQKKARPIGRAFLTLRLKSISRFRMHSLDRTLGRSVNYYLHYRK